jgi:hypothetical protein
MQPIVRDAHGVIRFKPNALVQRLFEAYPGGLDALALPSDSVEDLEQLAQLIGYSVSTFGDQAYASAETVAEADAKAAKLGAADPRKTPESRTWICGRLARVGRYTDRDGETVCHFMLDGDVKIYTAYISKFSTRMKATSLALAQVGDEVKFDMVDRDEVANFVNLAVCSGTEETS